MRGPPCPRREVPPSPTHLEVPPLEDAAVATADCDEQPVVEGEGRGGHVRAVADVRDVVRPPHVAGEAQQAHVAEIVDRLLGNSRGTKPRKDSMQEMGKGYFF